MELNEKVIITDLSKMRKVFRSWGNEFYEKYMYLILSTQKFHHARVISKMLSKQYITITYEGVRWLKVFKETVVAKNWALKGYVEYFKEHEEGSKNFTHVSMRDQMFELATYFIENGNDYFIEKHLEIIYTYLKYGMSVKDKKFKKLLQAILNNGEKLAKFEDPDVVSNKILSLMLDSSEMFKWYKEYLKLSVKYINTLKSRKYYSDNVLTTELFKKPYTSKFILLLKEAGLNDSNFFFISKYHVEDWPRLGQ